MNDDNFERQNKHLQGFAGCIIAFILLCLVSFICASLGGCATTKSHSGRVRESDSYFIGKLETTIERFDEGIAGAVERSRGIEDELERVDYLFGQYESAVGRLRDEVNTLRREIEVLEKDVHDSVWSANGDAVSDSRGSIPGTDKKD